jgi:hypothetical protein
VVLKESLVSPGLPSGALFLGGVNLPRLVEIAGDHSKVPDLFAAYNRICPPVDLETSSACFLFSWPRGY